MEFMIDGKTFSFDPADPSLPSWTEVLDEQGQVIGFRNDSLGMAFVHVKSPAGPYNQGVFYNRGGSVIVPTVQFEDETYFLVLRQVRPLVSDQPIIEFPRGQGFRGEESIETARRELLEETGLNIPVQNLVYLGHANPDTALVLDATVHAWQLRIPASYLEYDEFGFPKLSHNFGVNPKSKLMENILKAELITEEEFNSPSMMSEWAFGLALREIRNNEDAFDSGDNGGVMRIPRPYEY